MDDPYFDNVLSNKSRSTYYSSESAKSWANENPASVKVWIAKNLDKLFAGAHDANLNSLSGKQRHALINAISEMYIDEGDLPPLDKLERLLVDAKFNQLKEGVGRFL